MLALTPSDFDFEKQMVTKSSLNHEMERGAKQAGVKKIRVHDIRHPYVKPTTKKFTTFFEDFRAAA